MRTKRSLKPLLYALLFLALAVLLVGGVEYIIRMLPPAPEGAGNDALLAARPTILAIVRGAGIVLLLLAAWRFAAEFARAVQPAAPVTASDCSRCGAAGADSSGYCEACAAALGAQPVGSRTCPDCGVTNVFQAVYCENCGHPLPEDSAAQAPCPACGHGNTAESRFCEACGAALTEPEGVAEQCRECGLANPPGVAFCQRCGRALVVSEPEGNGSAT